MFELLPPATEPWRTAIARRHAPAETRNYRDFRSCLRWEFGFSCAFCLLHESDLSPHGTEGWGLMWIEHAELQSQEPGLAAQYENCFYSCRFCNEARGTSPRSDDGVRLLNPCEDSWRDHFDLVDGELRVRGESADAAYTLRLYDLNDPRKMRMRGLRREVIRESLDVVREIRAWHDRLLERAKETGDETLVDEAELAWKIFSLARLNLERFTPIPEDASSTCTCRPQLSQHSLPEVLAEQTIRIESSLLSWS